MNHAKTLNYSAYINNSTNLFIGYMPKERPHEHGKASGTIIIDKSKAILEVKIPALSVIGFEYHPKSKRT